LRHPLALFLGVAFGLAYPLATLVILAQRGVIPGAGLAARLGLDLERVAVLVTLLLGLLPAALLVTALEGGRPAVRALFRRALRWRVGPGWWLVVVAALPALTIMIATVMGDAVRMPGAGTLARQVAAILVAFFLVNLWEEIAWAGFLQTRLERRRNFFVAALLTALPFAAIHLPLQVIGGETTAIGLVAAFVILAIFGFVIRALLGAARRGTGDSLLAVGLLHTFFNESNNQGGIAAAFLDGPNRQGAALIATALLTVALCVAMRRRLGRAYREELDAGGEA
jgi:membrane protease YdiL (CAAX protease family)